MENPLRRSKPDNLGPVQFELALILCLGRMDSTVDPATLHRIELEAGVSNDMVLSPEEIAIAKSQIALLELKRSRTAEETQRMERLRTAAAPHKLLARELLGIIFRQMALGVPMLYPHAFYSDLGYQWPLRHVCSLWREIALSDASLWTSIMFHAGRVKYDEELRDKHLEFWLQNIVHPSHPLTLGIVSVPLRLLVFDFIQSKVIQPNSGRLRRLRLASFECTSYYHSLSPVNFPILEFFSCVIAPSIQKFPDLSKMPCLRILDMETRGTLEKMDMSCIPRAQLTRLFIGAETPEVWSPVSLTTELALDTLRSCRNLVHCTFQIAPEKQGLVVDPVLLPHLRSLNVFQTFLAEPQSTFLDFLKTPSLIDLTFAIESRIATAADFEYKALKASAVIPFIRRSGCQLRSLCLDSLMWNEFSDPDTEVLLELIPLVLMLQMPSIIFNQTTLQKVADTTFLSSVQYLTLSVAKVEEIATLAELIKNRFSGDLWDSSGKIERRPLQEVVVYIDDEIKDTRIVDSPCEQVTKRLKVMSKPKDRRQSLLQRLGIV